MAWLESLGSQIRDEGKRIYQNDILTPGQGILDREVQSGVTSICETLIRKFKNTFQRSIEIQISPASYNFWMEDALIDILSQYNKITDSGGLVLKDGLSSMRNGLKYILSDGQHEMKYRDFDILVQINTLDNLYPSRKSAGRLYTIVTYNLSPKFVELFERDMKKYRNAMLLLDSESKYTNVYTDDTEGYWDLETKVIKRKMDTVYMPRKQKLQLVNAINTFFASREFYEKNGIPHNMKILLYGPPGTGKDSIARMIAAEWNRNIYYVTGGGAGKYIPNSLISNDYTISYPLFLISDIDKYPYLINEAYSKSKDDKTKDEDGEEVEATDSVIATYKQNYKNMINALDGILSGRDKMIVMTTNHLDKFGSTFLRPGRIDLLMEIGYVTPEVFRSYIYHYYGTVLPEDIKLKMNNLTIAQLQGDVVFLKYDLNDIVKKYVK